MMLAQNGKYGGSDENFTVMYICSYCSRSSVSPGPGGNNGDFEHSGHAG
jgi:hypothetical protein